MSPQSEIQDTVPLPLLRRYLTARGWRLTEGSGPISPILHPQASAETPDRAFFESRSSGKRSFDIYVLSEPGLEDVELVVPKGPNSKDFGRRLQGAVLILSQIEDKEPAQIIAAVRSIGFDIVRSRIHDELVINDTIQLESARSYINGMTDLLAATATTEMRPLPFFGRQYKEATEYSDNCRFGHTYRGSFGFTIESPLVPNTQQLLIEIEPPPPFERRVVQRLATGIQQMCRAVDSEDPSPLLEAYREGFSANGLDRFANLVQSTAYSGMTFAFSFSPEWPVAQALAASAEFFVGPRHVEVARRAAQALRGRSPEIPTDIFGLVVRLQNEADPTDLSALMGEWGDFRSSFKRKFRRYTCQGHPVARQIPKSGRGTQVRPPRACQRDTGTAGALLVSQRSIQPDDATSIGIAIVRSCKRRKSPLPEGEGEMTNCGLRHFNSVLDAPRNVGVSFT